MDLLWLYTNQANNNNARAMIVNLIYHNNVNINHHIFHAQSQQTNQC